MLLLASSPAAAGGANIAVSGVAAATAGAAHIRAGRINWRLAVWMAPPSAAGALVGGYLAGVVPERALLLAIGAVLLYSGVDLLRGRAPAATTTGGALDVRAAVLAGAVIGLLGGFVGLILGSLRLPALLRLVGQRASKAVGTNLAVGVVVGVAGLLERDLAGDAARTDLALWPSQHRAEPAAPAAPPGAHVQVVADTDDPDRGGGAQRAVRPQRGDLQLVGRADPVELRSSPVAHPTITSGDAGSLARC
jgi:hypothetical protein